MSTEHTPGPWKARISDFSIDVIKDDDRAFGIVHIGTSRELKEAEYDFEEASSNAKLIAAAPELLEALIRFTEMHERGIKLAKEQGWPYRIYDEYRLARMAIKKATE